MSAASLLKVKKRKEKVKIFKVKVLKDLDEDHPVSEVGSSGKSGVSKISQGK